MSIAPPSDIILDVAQAADPQRLQAAATKLNAMATGSGGAATDFQSLLARAAAPPAKPPAAAGAASAGSTLFASHAPIAGPPMSPYRKFEAVLLQSFVQEMLPKDDDLFGDAASADAYRSMMAEQFATQIAKAGGIGIAAAVEHAHPATHAHAGKPAAKV